MTRGLIKATAAANTIQARNDWARLREWCRENGRTDLEQKYAPGWGDGWHRIDRSIAAVRSELGCPAGPFGDDVLSGIPDADREHRRGMSIEMER